MVYSFIPSTWEIKIYICVYYCCCFRRWFVALRFVLCVRGWLVPPPVSGGLRALVVGGTGKTSRCFHSTYDWPLMLTLIDRFVGSQLFYVRRGTILIIASKTHTWNGSSLIIAIITHLFRSSTRWVAFCETRVEEKCRYWRATNLIRTDPDATSCSWRHRGGRRRWLITGTRPSWRKATWRGWW